MTIPEPCILIIEDEAPIRKFLKASLAQEPYRVEFAQTAAEGLKQLTLQPPDILILDLGLPDGDGLDIIQRLREWSQLPIIVLSARGREEDKVTALELGADDYLTKPFGLAELLARLKVALRHAQRHPQSGQMEFIIGDLTVDVAARKVSVNNSDVALTPIEYKILAILVRHAGKVVTYNQLLKEVWGKHALEHNTTLRIHMQHIRRKLQDNPLQPRYITTEAGIGYRLKL